MPGLPSGSQQAAPATPHLACWCISQVFTEHLLHARCCSRHRVTGRQKELLPWQDGALLQGKDLYKGKIKGNPRGLNARSLENIKQVRRWAGGGQSSRKQKLITEKDSKEVWEQGNR